MFSKLLSFNWLKKSPKIIETRDFSCPGMAGFTFKYPVFEGWEVKEINGDVSDCSILLSSQGLAEKGVFVNIAPKITISIRPVVLNPDPKIHYPPDLAARTNTKNQYGIYYNQIIDAEDGIRFQSGLAFYIPIIENTHEAIKILPPNFPESEYGFSADLFFKTVIESFRVID